MANYDACGTITKIMEPKTFPSGFMKREFVVVTEEDYPQTVQFECIKQQCGLLDRVAANDRVRVSFRLRGREYQERIFVNLEAVQIEKIGAAGVMAPPDEKTESALLDSDPPF